MIAQSKTHVYRYGTGESTVVKCRYLSDDHNCIPYFFPAYRTVSLRIPALTIQQHAIDMTSYSDWPVSF